jgi:hypothetical protein
MLKATHLTVHLTVSVEFTTPQFTSSPTLRAKTCRTTGASSIRFLLCARRRTIERSDGADYNLRRDNYQRQ